MDQEFEQQTAIMLLEAKAIRIQHDMTPKEIKERVRAWQTQVRADMQAIRERHTLERASRKRGERVPNIHTDPEAYVLWMQRQRALPYIELARDLNEQSRQSRGGLR